MPEASLSETVVLLARKVHHHLGPGFPREVYLNALAVEFEEQRFRYQRDRALDVVYRKRVIGSFTADYLVQDRVLLLIRACETLSPADEIHMVNQVAATGVESGVLLNFGSATLQARTRHPGDAAGRQSLPAPGRSARLPSPSPSASSA